MLPKTTHISGLGMAMATRPVLAVQGLKYLLIMAASLYFLAYILLAICRLSYPFELEWMEGGAVDHVRKILAGESLYARPGIAFTPYGYTPLYFYLAAVVSKAVGVGFFPLRLVSFISSLACFVIIFQIVKSETQSHLASFLASALFAATFRISGA